MPSAETSNLQSTNAKRSGPPSLVLARGNPQDRGRTIGEATSELITAALDVYETRFAVETGLSKHEQRELANGFSTAISVYSPDIYDTLRGMAEGAGVSLERIVLLNARTEVLYSQGRLTEQDGACTTGAVLPERSSTGHTYVLQNWDWRDNLSEQTFLLGTEDNDGFRTLTLTEAGMLAKSGVNSAGVGLAVNLLASDRPGLTGGVPFHIIARKVLESRAPSYALRAAIDTRRSSAGNLVLGFSGGEAVDIELVPDDFTVEYPKRGILTHANHFRNRRDWADTFGPRSALSYIRDERLFRLLDGTGETITEPRIVDALRDHFSYPDGICRHVDDFVDPAERVATLHSLLIDLDDRCLWIAPQNACANPYYRFSIDDLFTPASTQLGFMTEETHATHSHHP